MRWVVGGRATVGQAASASQMGRFETEVLAQTGNLAALAELASPIAAPIFRMRLAINVLNRLLY